jgi:ATP-dependent helicase Lhr and Lhr-like helicase
MSIPTSFDAWFAARGWRPFAFQHEVWQAMAGGSAGLLHANTGSGKTYAVWFGALARAQDTAGLQVLWITPMRALASDTVRALQLPLPDVLPAWRVGQRTGDTPAGERAKQDRRMPAALVTTPESLSLMLTRERAAQDLAGVHTVIVDEWHELIGNKRGVQVQLALARLKRWNPKLVTWGLSATLGNLDDAMQVLCGGARSQVVQGRIDKAIVIDTLLPEDPGRFSWGGHLGAQMQQPVVEEIERTIDSTGGTTLVFTNVRSQAEIWYQLLLAARPQWAGQIALHHGSLDREVREWVEAGLKDGSLKAVVATSSLDLGVDFLPVERVLQIGSPKGVARLLQRAGRSGHAPGRASRVTLVPTNTLELVEAAAARRAALAGRVESRTTPDKPLDVLVQHLVTVGLGSDIGPDRQPRAGFDPAELFSEVRAAPAYRTLTRDEFDWCLAFVERGGSTLGAYPQYHRVVRGDDGRYRVTDRGIALRHRLQVGTIVSDAAMQVAWLSGGRIGTVEEGFIARLKPGDCFVFAGRVLEYVRTQDMTAYVRKATKNRGIVPAWGGTKMALSEAMTDMVQQLLFDSAQGDFLEPEMQAARPMLSTQARLSKLPRPNTLLIERFASREGHHLFLYPFGGRNVHMGLAQLLAWRLSRLRPNTFSLSINDFGLELLAVQAVDVAPLLDGRAFTGKDLMADVLASLNSGALAQRRFREIARVAGLIFTGYPGAAKSAKQLQASSSLFWEVFRKYDAGNRLLTQAEREVLAQELELERLRSTLKRMASQRAELVELRTPSPFALPLMVERFREELSTEKLADRLQRILADAAAVLDSTDAAAVRDSTGAQAVPDVANEPALPRRRAARRGRQSARP